jgi:hypothetical protein
LPTNGEEFGMSCRLTAAVTSVVLAAAPVLLTGSATDHADPTAATVSSVGDRWGCTPLEPVRMRYLRANGNTLSATAPPEAKRLATREFSYRLPDGPEATTVIEPHVADPSKVDSIILRALGYDVRQAAYRNYGKTYPSTLCKAWGIHRPIQARINAARGATRCPVKPSVAVTAAHGRPRARSPG